MDLEIKKGTDNDLDAIEKLYNDLHVALETGMNYPGWIKDVYPTCEDAMAGIDNQSLYVARFNNKVVGSIILNHEADDAYSTAKWQCDVDYSLVFIIHTLVVHPSYSKMGIGKQLMDFAEVIAHQNNMKAIRLDVYEKNTPAIYLYERCGYTYISLVDLGYSKYGLDYFRLYEKLL